ncbi:MAG: hypothetical protein ACD_62C00260G0004 [uncultured bacterium]|nr:MAG: hypothetical protein ACD_62C00260G0004 [uncultured bacterium]
MKNTFPIIIATIVFAVFLFSFVSEAQAGKTNLYKDKREYITVKAKKGENFNHPRTLTPQQLTDLLSKVQYRHCQFICVDSSAPEPAFTHRQIALLSQHAAKGLEQASNTELVEFFLTTPSRDFKRYTKGKLFIINDELHIIFDRLSEAGADNDPGQYQHGQGRWQVIASGNQRVQINPYGSSQKNWLVLSLASETSKKGSVKKK